MTNVWHPGKLLSTSSAYWQGCTLQSAVRLKVFSILEEKQMSGEDVASELGSDAISTILFLDALSAMGLLLKKNERYRNCPESEKYLIESSPDYMGHIILHHHHLLDGWAQLDQVIQTGNPAQKRSYGQAEERESFLMGMFNLAMQIAPQIADQIELTGRSRLLDLGGGPGTYAIHFCKANPNLSAVIFDRPTTEPFAQQTVATFGLSDRISFEAGDFNSDPITCGPYDVAWLSHILHSNTMDQCFEIIAKCVRSMKKGGMVLIHDFILDDSKDGPEFPALFSLNMLIGGTGGRSYSEEEICNMLRASGVPQPQRHPFKSKNDSSIIYGIVEK